MNMPLENVRGALSDLLNAIDDVRGTDAVTDEGQTTLDELEAAVDALVRKFDADFNPDTEANG
jgi:hypothetical protein